MMNPEVTTFLDKLAHPLRAEIEALRQALLEADSALTENIKWNGPNYCDGAHDRITMRIQPPRQIQLIFHRGAKKLEQPKARLISDTSGLLSWRENDRAIATFKTMEAVKQAESNLKLIVKAWLEATR
ncbi:MAG: DUF1801 domain-containing protein [Phaeodactylibacter sp.]|nr:DUF1801 domain-containing protein [Phaeodactylibacter sp.]MCB9277114.1 DUF1801 domain-containing protein [Lewinellaceae bacterium]